MSSKIHSAFLSQFNIHLENLREAVISPEPKPDVIKQQFDQLEQQLTQNILTVPPESVNSAIANIWEGLKTEMHRNLRLLKTDFAFFESSLKAGKKPKTKRLCYNLDQLMALCSFVLKEELQSENPHK